MKRMLLVLVLLAATKVFGIPYTELNLTATKLRIDTLAPASGGYAEIVLLQSAVLPVWANTLEMYNSVTIARFSDDGATTVNTPYTSLGTLRLGYDAAGTDLGSGGGIATYWQFSNTEYDDGDYWVAIRYYDNAVKGSATKYGITSFKQIPTTAVVGESPTQGAYNPVWSTTQNNSYAIPAVPEPATMALFGLGGLALVIRRKLRKES